MLASTSSCRLLAAGLLGGVVACVPEVVLPPAAPAPAAKATAPRGPRPIDDPARAVVVGVVRGPDGTPFDEALVAVVSTSEDLGESAWMVSGGGGRFRFADLQPGTYAVTATAPGLTAAYVDVGKLEAGKPTSWVKVKLGGDGLRIRGIVRDPAGNPMPGLLVRLLPVSEVKGDLFLARTDARGAYEVALPIARYDVRVQVPGMGPFQQPTAGAGDETVDVSFVADASFMPDPEAPPIKRETPVPRPPRRASTPPSAKACPVPLLCPPK